MDQGSLEGEIAFLQSAADVAGAKTEKSNGAIPPADGNVQLEYDFVKHFRRLGNSVLSLFKTQELITSTVGNSAEDDFEGAITIEVGEDKAKKNTPLAVAGKDDTHNLSNKNL